MARCWTCRKRRLKCDGGVPYCKKCWGHGVVCLGYQKPLTWVEGVARRGPMKNRTFGSSAEQQPPRNRQEAIAIAITSGSIPLTPTESLFQDLDSASRFFVDYFSKRVCPTLVVQDRPDNHYRRTITCVSSPVVASAIVTVAACHYIQSQTGCPLFQQALVLRNNPIGSDLSREAVFKYYLKSKGKCLKLISAALAQHHSESGDSAILIAVVLLTILDMFESGSGAWSLHLEGAQKLLNAGIMAGTSEWDSVARKLLHGAAVIQTFGSSLAKPGVLTSESTLPTVWTEGSWSITPIGCPVEILAAVEVFASQRRLDSILTAPVTDGHILADTLHRIRSYDIPAWAARTMTTDAAVPYEDLVYLGTIWKLSADIYACCFLRSSSQNTSRLLEPPSVQALMVEYSFFEQKNDAIIRCLIWPTFVAGAASTSPEERAWVLRTLERIWNFGHCANTRSATKVLETLWEKHDREKMRSSQARLREGAEPLAGDFVGWDWIKELSQLKGSWLFI
ncbi:fungal-specific transcription factor domain-containing protein [Triangularia setosa]|uniref:Fungal-specific transcription factor domain-containing protein n=1 Tax=Triangularia setosa TaxID=2587417 RepID=A0AAN7A3J5_9PEZI|nr:fungal-specific transcription factor domain-containing protein [Podospora setosa]